MFIFVCLPDRYTIIALKVNAGEWKEKTKVEN